MHADFPTVMVESPKKRRWPMFLFGAVALLGGAIGVGYFLGQNGAFGNQGATAEPPQPAAGAAPMLAGAAEQEAEQPQPALARSDEAEQQAEAAVALTGDAPEQAQPQVAFDAAFDIIVEPAGATVYLDGKELGPAPLRIGRLAAGAHTLELHAPEGYVSQTIPLELVSGERQVIRMTLDPLAAEAPEPEVVAAAVEEEPAGSSFRTKRPEREAKPEKKLTRRSHKRAEKSETKESKKASSSGGSATLMIGSKPPCKIFIDGKDTGLMTPQRSITVKPGKHKITLVNQQHGLKASATVRVKAGETKRLIKDMSSRL